MKLGLLGAGTVGSAVAQLVTRTDSSMQITKALVRDTTKSREGLKPEQLTTKPDEILADADIIIELMGGTTLAGDLTLQALQEGKRVVTGNKAVLAERWDELKPFAQQGLLYIEAAVMAGTPVVGPLTGALRGSRPLELHAILNGTCNYILSELENGISYDDALAEAQRLGYAEADPTLDVGGFDTAHKLTVLARLVFDPNIGWASVEARTRGISELSPKILKAAQSRGGRVRLVGSIYPAAGAWQTVVRPVFLPNAHPMASAASNLNALYFRGDAVGEVFITGAGAGGMPTASGVLGDVLSAAQGRPGPSLLTKAAPVPDETIEVLEEI